MTPKEKAKELTDKMNLAYEDVGFYYSQQKTSKLCAIIAVNEILDSCPMYYKGFEYESNLEYWQEVKTEIKKL